MIIDADGVVQFRPDKLEPEIAWIAPLIGLLERRYLRGGDFAEAINAVTAAVGLSETYKSRILRFHVSHTLDEAVLQKLAQSPFRLALLSNQTANRAARMVPSFEPYIPRARQFYSCDLGVRKPDPNALLNALAILGADPSTAVFIDDREENVREAQRVGVQAILFKRHGGVREALRIVRLLQSEND